jgi:hypothetical protein
MILHFRVLSNEVDNFLREISIDSTATFKELHDYIQSCLDFDITHMASFILTDSEWNRQKEISLINLMDDNHEVLLMDQTILQQHVSNLRQRLLYVFDFFSERAFFIEVFKMDDGRQERPKLENSEGKPPTQIQVGDMVPPTANGADWMDYDADDLESDFERLDSLDFDNLPDLD